MNADIREKVTEWKALNDEGNAEMRNGSQRAAEELFAQASEIEKVLDLAGYRVAELWHEMEMERKRK